MAPRVPIAARVDDEYKSEPEDDRDHGRSEHDNGNQEFSDASEHLPQSEIDEMVPDPMPNPAHFNGSHDPLRGQPPNAVAYGQDPEDARGPLHYDEEAYEMQEQMFDDARYQDQEVPVHDQPTQYYQERFGEDSMHPEMAYTPSKNRSNRAHILADFQRVAADDYGGFNDPARYVSSRQQPFGHQTWAKTASRKHYPSKVVKKTSKEKKKKKKPPRSLARRTATQTTEYPPTPATDQEGGRHVHFQPDQQLVDTYTEQQQYDGSEHADVAEDGTRDATPELHLRRGPQLTSVPAASRHISTRLQDGSAIHGGAEPPSPPPTRSAASRPAPHSVGVKQVSSHPDAFGAKRRMLPSRSTSKRTRAPQTTPRADTLAVHGSTVPSSDPPDPMQAIQAVSEYLNSMANDQAKQEARHQAERDGTQRELQQIDHDRQIAEDECHTLRQDNQSLEVEVKKCRDDLDKYRNLKLYVDTFGNDLTYLKRDNKSQIKNSAQLMIEANQRQEQQELCLQQLRNDTAKNVQLRNEALKACRQAQSELSNTATQLSQLQQELNMKDKFLVEEKNLRLQFQAQLNAAGHDREAILRQLKSNNDAVLDKLYEVHGTLEESTHKQEGTEMLEKIATTVQSLGSRPTATVEDVVAVKALVESLSENVIITSNVNDETVDQAPGLKTCIEESLNGLKAELIKQEKLAAEAATCRATDAGLTEKLNMSEERVAEYKAQISDTQAKVTEANELNATLRAKVAELEMSQTTYAASSTNVQGLEADLQAKDLALNAVRAELDAKKEELGVLQATNASLQDEVKGLKQQLEELSAASTRFTAERAQWEKKTADAVEKKRQEMATAVTEVNAMEKSQLADEKKRLSKQGDKLRDAQQKIHDLESELHTVKVEPSKKEQKLQAELTAAGERARARAKEVETLQAKINAMQDSASFNAGEAEKCQRLESQLQKLKSEADKLGAKVKALEKQIEAEKVNRSNAETLTETAERELETNRAELNSAQKHLTEAVQKVDEQKDGMERYKASCEEHRKMEEESVRKREAALQDQLQEVKADLQERERKDLAFQAQVQDSWDRELAQQKKDLAKANEKAQKAEDERNRAQATVAELQLKLEQVSNGQAEREDVQNQKQMAAPSMYKEGTDNVLSAQPGGSMAHASKMSKGITPTEAPDVTQPMRPRKKVDRNTRSIKKVKPIPAPEMLRPTSVRPTPMDDESVASGPVVEESQQHLIACAESDMHMSSPRAGSCNPFELNRAVPPPKATAMSNSRYQDVVPETQFDEAGPSFAAFNASHSSSRPNGPASLHHMSRYKTAPDFQIYEDVDEPDDAITQNAAQYLQDSLPPAKDPYVYEKPMPPPNSSSKLVRNDSDKSQNSRGSRGPEPSRKKVERRKSSQFKTPETNRVPGGAGIPSLSSSPGFMATSKPARATTTFNGGSGKKRRTSRRQSDLAKEPVTKMAATPKRKNEASVVAGYEEERRKRVKPSNVAPTASRAELRSTTQPAGAASSHASLMSELSIPRGPSRGALQPSRMQTLAGQPARAQGAKNHSRHDQMSARFQEELNRGRR